MHDASRRPVFLFDLDGTLIDSAPDIARAVNRLIARFGAAPLELTRVRGFIGDGASILIERVFDAAGLPLAPAEIPANVAAYIELYEAEPVVDTVCYPGAVALLERLCGGGARLGICTNKPERLSHMVLERMALARYFAGVSGGDSGPAKKPDPGHILDALARVGGGDPAAAWMIGDSENDALAARAAGMPVALLRHGYARRPVEELGADRVLAGLDEVAGLIAR